MKTRIIRIGNSRGIRVPKPLLEQSGLGEAVGQEVEIEVGPMRLVIQPARRPRQGWDEAFEAMAAAGDDAPVDDAPASTRWDDEEWQW